METFILIQARVKDQNPRLNIWSQQQGNMLWKFSRRHQNTMVYDKTNRDAITFIDIMSSVNLVQHVEGSTHRRGHTLDIIATLNQYLYIYVHILFHLLTQYIGYLVKTTKQVLIPCRQASLALISNEESLNIQTILFLSIIFLQSIKFPCTQEEVRDTQRRFFLLASFPNVVGAIDGTHVRINGVPLGAAEHLFVNRKGFYSINVQLTCNARYEITSISARWPGSTHDSRICRTSVIAQAFREGALNGLLLGDSGYGLQSWLMTPVPLPRTRGERRYNQAHSCTRVVIEQVNGQLKSKFRCLIGGGLNMIPERASDVITACACLHNISKQMKQPEVEQERVDDDAGDEANDLNEEGDAMTGKQVRDDIIRSFFA
ncbi:putative nuclease HARBI1 [Lytechinus pictus]|uniref:putative nuclease HARBI1 n=1 Tax=Lytechinus pictus TaxID=7653 RepID=UPI0030B9E402